MENEKSKFYRLTVTSRPFFFLMWVIECEPAASKSLAWSSLSLACIFFIASGSCSKVKIGPCKANSE